jgi:DedD protein
MSQRSLSRSERRMERKQAIILLFLVLAVSLVSFSLGVMVGRGGAAKQVVRTEPQPLPQRPVAASPEPAVPAKLDSSTQSVTTRAEEVQATEAAAEKPAEQLTFYDTLPRGDLPLGSGINLPPAKSTPAQAVPVAETVKASAPASTRQPVVQRSEVKPTIVAPPVASSTGRYVVQLASFKDSAAAAKLKQQLGVKGYSLFVEPADLGSKGVWHRVYAGPYADKSTADRVASQLKQREKFSPLVRKR